MAGIQVFATGGIGGVHRGAETTMDISADLEELAQTPVMVVCAGAKSILDLGLTLEYLETKGVPVIGYGTKELPAFYTRKSGFAVDYEIDTPEDLAKAFHVARQLEMKGGMLVTNPIPEEYSMDTRSSTPPSSRPWPMPRPRASTARRPPPSCWPGSRTSPAATAWTATSSWCITTPAWLPRPPAPSRPWSRRNKCRSC